MSGEALNLALAELDGLASHMHGLHHDKVVATHTIGSLFANWSSRDAVDSNLALDTIVQQLTPSTRYHPESYSGGWPEWHQILPRRLHDDALAAVRVAIMEARQKQGNIGTEQAATFSLDGATIDEQGYWRSPSQHVILGHSYSKMNNFLNGLVEVLGDDEPTSPAALDRLAHTYKTQRRAMQRLGLNLAVCHLNPANHLTQSLELNTTAGGVRSCVAQLALAARHPEQAPRIIIQIKNDLPGWAYSRHEGLRYDLSTPGSNRGREHATRSLYGQHDVEYDIDHPKARQYMHAFLGAAARHLGCHPALDSWILGNEVNFYTTASPHAVAKYATFLERKYRGQIEQLQGAWGRWDVGDFHAAAALLDPAEPDAAISVDAMDSGAVRHFVDWSQFNAERVMEWARGLRAAVRAAGCPSRCTIKFNTAPTLPVGHNTNGIDRPAMIEELDVSGFSTGTPPPSIDGHSRGIRGNPLFYDNRKYSCDWLHVAMILTLQRSLGPSKLAFNQEWHLFTDCCVSPRIHQTDTELTRVRVWLSALFGQGAHLLWYWGRGRDGTPTAQLPIVPSSAKQFPESILTLPLVMDAWHRAWAELQHYADAIAALADAPRRVWLLTCWSSTYASSAHATAIYSATEALVSLGTPFGFLSTRGNATHTLEQMLRALPADDWVVLPGCTHVTTDAIAALAARQRDSPGHLLALGSSPDEPLAFDERSGQRFARDSTAAWLGKERARFVRVQPPESLVKQLEQHIFAGAPATSALRPLECSDADKGGAEVAFGVFCRAAAVSSRRASSAGGRVIEAGAASTVFLVVLNLRSLAARVHLRLSAPLEAACMPFTECTDVLGGATYALLAEERHRVFSVPVKGLLLLQCGAPPSLAPPPSPPPPPLRPPPRPLLSPPPLLPPVPPPCPSTLPGGPRLAAAPTPSSLPQSPFSPAEVPVAWQSSLPPLPPPTTSMPSRQQWTADAFMDNAVTLIVLCIGLASFAWELTKRFSPWMSSQATSTSKRGERPRLGCPNGEEDVQKSLVAKQERRATSGTRSKAKAKRARPAEIEDNADASDSEVTFV